MKDQDRILVEKARNAAAELAIALNEAADAGLLLECSAQPNGSQSDGRNVIGQFSWVVRVFAKRVVHI